MLDPLAGDQVLETNAGPWVAPIGIPAPAFGISQTAPPAPNPWNGTVSGHYYVDNTHPSATDSNNPNGYPSRPRRTIPNSSPLPPGSRVEVRGGPYSYGSGGFMRVNAQGTASNPVFIKGVGMPRFNQPLSVYSSSGVSSYYLIMEGLSVYRSEIIAPAHHIVLRHCEVRGGSSAGGVSISSYSGSYSLNHIVVYANDIHDNGDWQADFDQDVHGVAVSARASYIWILDNELYHNSGDGVQINAGSLSNQPTTHHIYVGGNLAWENKQTGLWTKQAVDVIFSENTVHSHWPIGSSPSAWGAGMGYQYGPERVWFLYNHIYNCAFGIQANSTNGLGNGENSYFIGNVIHDIHHHPSYSYSPTSAWSNAGIMLVGTPNRWIVNNTIWNVDAGINGPSSGMYYMANNIIANVTVSQGNHVFLENSAAQASSRIYHTVFGNAARIRWGSSTVYSLSGFQSAFPSSTSGCLNANPQFVNSGAADFHLQGASAAVDRGMNVNVYSTFQSLYGLNISRDADGMSRPQGLAIDAGAYEFADGSIIPGDLDGDGDVDLGDFAILIACLTGPTGSASSPCSAASLDGDNDVDLADLAIFQRLAGL